MEMQEAAEALLERNAELEQQKRSLVRAPPVGVLTDLAYFCLVCMWQTCARPKRHADHELHQSFTSLSVESSLITYRTTAFKYKAL